jgi:hypothetical protein
LWMLIIDGLGLFRFVSYFGILGASLKQTQRQIAEASQHLGFVEGGRNTRTFLLTFIFVALPFFYLRCLELAL